jgi:hypothetical protein
MLDHLSLGRIESNGRGDRVAEGGGGTFGVARISSKLSMLAGVLLIKVLLESITSFVSPEALVVIMGGEVVLSPRAFVR